MPINRGLDNFPYYEAHGLAILALSNREWSWPLGRIETAVEVLTVACVVLLLLVGTRLRSHLATAGASVAAGVAVALLVWNVSAEVYAAVGEHDLSARVEKNLPQPHDWVDRAAGDGTVAMLGQRMSPSIMLNAEITANAPPVRAAPGAAPRSAMAAPTPAGTSSSGIKA